MHWWHKHRFILWEYWLQNTNNEGEKNRRDLGFACQMMNYLAQERGEEMGS